MSNSTPSSPIHGEVSMINTTIEAAFLAAENTYPSPLPSPSQDQITLNFNAYLTQSQDAVETEARERHEEIKLDNEQSVKNRSRTPRRSKTTERGGIRKRKHVHRRLYTPRKFRSSARPARPKSSREIENATPVARPRRYLCGYRNGEWVPVAELFKSQPYKRLELAKTDTERQLQDLQAKHERDLLEQREKWEDDQACLKTIYERHCNELAEMCESEKRRTAELAERITGELVRLTTNYESVIERNRQTHERQMREVHHFIQRSNEEDERRENEVEGMMSDAGVVLAQSHIRNLLLEERIADLEASLSIITHSYCHQVEQDRHVLFGRVE